LLIVFKQQKLLSVKVVSCNFEQRILDLS